MIIARVFLGAERGIVIIIILQTEAASLKIAITQEENKVLVMAVISGESWACLDPFAADLAGRVTTFSEHLAGGLICGFSSSALISSRRTSL